jgi:hypothetical protein
MELPDVYSYRVSLRVRHPTIQPAEISAALSLVPRFAWAAGSPEPSSTDPAAMHESTYWSAVLDPEPGLSLATFLDRATRRLEVHAAFLSEVRSTGGAVEYFVGWFLNRNAGELLPHTLLRRLAEMGIDLALDLYGPESPAT